MAAIKLNIPRLPDGNIDLSAWLQHLQHTYSLENTDLIANAVVFAESTSRGLTTCYGQPCIEQGLEIAEIIADLKLDQEAIAAGILASTLQHTKLPPETIKEQFNGTIAALALGVLQMNIINTLQTQQKDRDPRQTDRLRKTFLAMVSDIRVVLIKLAEQLCIMRGIKNVNPAERLRIAQATLDIYAPLANRLGIGQIKWELEDIAFHYTDPDTYKTIAAFLAERRIDREQRIQTLVLRLKEKFAALNINASISGRAKHIYSIYLKMQKKHLDLKDIYDVSAVRILVDKLEDCYTVLSIAHSLYDHVPQEFDDYIANPKPNGYRSIHTAVIDPAGKHLEIQIRTHQMHNEAEHGVAAHWLYKEGAATLHLSGYEAKITFLRQLLAWHKDLSRQDSQANHATPPKTNSSGQENSPAKLFQAGFEDRVYAFTPNGDIIDLPIGATPLDFAYHIHSQLGHRCRGAKINGHIVPLTHALRTGDRIEILTIQNGAPSRDWLNKNAGYLKTSRARAKVMQWFNQQEVEQYINTAKHTLEREFTRAGIRQVDLQKIAARLHFKNANALLSSLGHGSIRIAQILHAAQAEPQQEDPALPAALPTHQPKEMASSAGLEIAGINDLLTRIARCCKPIPGDAIIGYITQGRGVSIHRQDCTNLSHLTLDNNNRLIKVNWDNKQLGAYYVDLQIRAQGRETLLKEITTIITNGKIDLIAMNSTIHKKSSLLFITLTVQLHDIVQLQHLLNQIKQLPQVISVTR